MIDITLAGVTLPSGGLLGNRLSISAPQPCEARCIYRPVRITFALTIGLDSM
jgi:hypothetical protein